MMFQPEPSYSYQDIGLVPLNKSTIESRDDVQTHISFLGADLKFPLLSAPMESAIGLNMVRALEKIGCISVLSRVDDPIENAKVYVRSWGKEVIPSIPARSGIEWWNHILYYLGNNLPKPFAVCIDTANGFHIATEDTVTRLKELFPDIKIIAGNIGSITGYIFMKELGVDAVRVGIGNGSVCTTSMATGIGIGQASLVREIWQYKEEFGGPLIIADGGIQSAGDIAKAIALGADVVMVGKLLAGCEESPGTVIKYRDKLYKQHAGQASFAIKRSKEYIEGDDTLVPYIGTVAELFAKLNDGLRSAMSYMNAENLNELRGLPDETFRLLIGAASKERQVHA